MIRTIITGSAGRMGKSLVAAIAANPEFQLAGATEYPASPLIGQDAGTVAGVAALNVPISASLTQEMLANSDAIIDFSTGNVLENARAAAKAGLSIVIGTTALTDADKAALRELSAQGARIVQTFNYSVGVNLLFFLSGKTASLLAEDFDMEIIEAHHNQKKDAPSGTAVRLAEVLCEAADRTSGDLVYGRQGIVGARTRREIGIHAVRGGDIVGDHTVLFAGDGERIELTHRASSRMTFAKGALRAAKWLAGASAGYYDMQDVLGLK
jgi:4-hydroxy-tetrahydrodipicolinate reductase